MATTWKASVNKARRAISKTFEGRMEAAQASFEQIPPKGKGASGTLVEFAEQAGIAYSSLTHYRGVWLWLGQDFAYVRKIGSYSTALEAMESGRWKSGAKFVAMIESNPTPTLALDGFEPHTFASWTLDALRVYLGRQPTNTTMIALEAAQKGEEPQHDDITIAESSDALNQSDERWEQARPIVERKREEQRATSRAVRHEHTEEPWKPLVKIIALDVLAAEHKIERAIAQAKDADIPEEAQDRPLAHIDRLRRRIDLLELAITNRSNVDWDKELAALIGDD